MKYFIGLMLILISLNVYGKSEDDWVREWCPGIVEKLLKDYTRVDCVTRNFAIEADWAKKWAEGIGQSLFYSAMTGRNAGLLLITESEKDCKYVDRTLYAIRIHGLPIQLFTYPVDCL